MKDNLKLIIGGQVEKENSRMTSDQMEVVRKLAMLSQRFGMRPLVTNTIKEVKRLIEESNQGISDELKVDKTLEIMDFIFSPLWEYGEDKRDIMFRKRLKEINMMCESGNFVI